MTRSRKMVFPVLLIVALVPPAVMGSDWPQFRGPGGQGVSDAKGLPIKWGGKQNVVWRRELPGAGSSSPIVLGDRIYLTCYSGYGLERGGGEMGNLKLHLVCIAAKDGKLLFDKRIPPRLPESDEVRDHGYAAPTPATDGTHLFVFFGKSGVFKFDLDGKQIWNADVGSKTHGWGCGTSPVLFENVVIVNASVESGQLVGIDKESGKALWRADGMTRSWSTPHLVEVDGGGTEVVVSVRGRILGFDPKAGKELWSCKGIDDYICPSIVSQNGIVYAIGGRDSRAIAVRAGGRGDVTKSHRLWEAQAGSRVSSPVVHDGHLYWVSDNNRAAYCLRLSDGEIVYRERMPASPYASMLAADGRLYVVTRQSGTFVLAAKPEFEQLAHNELDDGSTFNASPSVVGSRLLLRSDRYLYCIGDER